MKTKSDAQEQHEELDFSNLKVYSRAYIARTYNHRRKFSGEPITSCLK